MLDPDNLLGLRPDDDTTIRLERIEYALRTMAWWLVQAQTGFGREDARGINAILGGKRDEDMLRAVQNQDVDPAAGMTQNVSKRLESDDFADGWTWGFLVTIALFAVMRWVGVL